MIIWGFQNQLTNEAEQKSCFTARTFGYQTLTCNCSKLGLLVAKRLGTRGLTSWDPPQDPNQTGIYRQSIYYHSWVYTRHFLLYIYDYMYMMHIIYINIYNVNPGLINPKRLFNWEGTIQLSDNDYWSLVPPNQNKPWFSKIRGWHYIYKYVYISYIYIYYNL